MWPTSDTANQSHVLGPAAARGTQKTGKASALDAGGRSAAE